MPSAYSAYSAPDHTSPLLAPCPPETKKENEHNQFSVCSISQLTKPLSSSSNKTNQMFFIAFVLFLAAAWAVLGIFLAKWLKQAGYARPFRGREFTDTELYGSGVGVGNQKGIPNFGQGRVKGI